MQQRSSDGRCHRRTADVIAVMGNTWVPVMHQIRSATSNRHYNTNVKVSSMLNWCRTIQPDMHDEGQRGQGACRINCTIDSISVTVVSNHSNPGTFSRHLPRERRTLWVAF